MEKGGKVGTTCCRMESSWGVMRVIGRLQFAGRASGRGAHGRRSKEVVEVRLVSVIDVSGLGVLDV